MDGSFWRFKARMVTIIVPLLCPRPLPSRPLPKPLPECNQGHRLRPRPTTTRDETFLPKRNLPYLETRVTSIAAQLAENGAETVCVRRFGLGASFLSA